METTLQVHKVHSSQASESGLKTVKIASVGSDADIWRHIAESEQAKKAGLKIEVQEINGGVPLNESVADGTVDANAFQSIGYLQGFNEANSNKLVPVGTTYIEPMGLYSKKVKSLNDLPNGAKEYAKQVLEQGISIDPFVRKVI